MKLTVHRSADPQHPVTYEVPEYEGMTVLDALNWIRTHHDPSLAVQFSCRSANACRECACLVDGSPAYICTVPATGRITVEPLPNRPHLHDLAVEL